MVTTAMGKSPSEKVVRLRIRSHVQVFILHPGTVPAPHPVRGTVAEQPFTGARSQSVHTRTNCPGNLTRLAPKNLNHLRRCG